jgi:ribosomal protein S18 acetylase RimI-like enzyme
MAGDGRHGTVDGVRVRWATAADIGELVRLRRVMFEAMGMEVTAADDEATRVVLGPGLDSGEFFAAVIDSGAADGHLAACGIGMTARRVPSPGNPEGRYGYVQSMVTDERDRRQGHARAVLRALLDRFGQLGIARVDLHASAMGEPLYRSEGFRPGTQPELRWRAEERQGATAPAACEP